MTRRTNTILTYIILVLLGAALIASGRMINSLKSEPEKDYATKLAELRADLTEAAKTGNKQNTSKSTNRTTPRRSHKTRPS